MLSQKRRLDASDEQPSKKRAIGSAILSGDDSSGAEEYWMVQWRNLQTKKHKTWDGDGILVVSYMKGTLYNEERNTIASGKVEGPLTEGRTFSWATKDLELDRRLTRSEYISSRAFGATDATPTPYPPKSRPMKPFITPSIRPPGSSKPQIPVKSSPGLAAAKPSPLNNTTINVDTTTPGSDQHWTANWRKPQTKKHRTWDGDAYVSLSDNRLVMVSEEGELMGSTKWKGDKLYSGYATMINGKTVELDVRVNAVQVPKIRSKERNLDDLADVDLSSDGTGMPTSMGPPKAPMPAVSAQSASKFVAPASFYGSGAPAKKSRAPLHDPEAEGAVVMKAPTKDHMEMFNKKNYPVVPVVLDPILSRKMRPHQIEGVKFMYEAVMGLRKHEGQGCILADEMGLGKTLQTVALVWTLLKQNPYGSPFPAVQKALIVAPVSLLNNWKAEFHKWLGRDRVGVVVCDKDKKAALMFMNAKNQQVLIIGYERLRTVIDDLASMIPPIGLIVCDEGHRLKSANNKTVQMLMRVKTPRRVILSGTPIQNDLSEFHTMADFCNPGLLDTYATFRKAYETPIVRSRAPDASAKEVELGKARTAQLLAVSKSFVLRRETNILKNQLPPKHEYVVFVKPTSLQLSLFSKILQPTRIDDLIQGSTAESLAVINTLTKISNSPILLKATADKAKGNSENTFLHSGIRDAVSILPQDAQITDVKLSGKLSAIARLLKLIWKTTEEKCVLVSHYTSTINILEAFCREKHYSYHRLDGQTPANKRQELVTTFNKSSRKQSFIFLLSSKAGGVGLNLIGASRLCLVDSDWNPTHDLQSMARCYRDGQKRPVYIYRLLTAGTIDEKIYQRQVTKLGLSDSLMGSSSTASKSDSFTKKDLRDIFRVHPDTACHTHELLECPCGNDGTSKSTDSDVSEDEDGEDSSGGFMKAVDFRPELVEKLDRAYIRKQKAGLAALGEWKHHNCLRNSTVKGIEDTLLREMISFGHLRGRQESDNSEHFAWLDHQVALDELPGGSITFLFERSATLEELASVEEISEAEQAGITDTE